MNQHISKLIKSCFLEQLIWCSQILLNVSDNLCTGDLNIVLPKILSKWNVLLCLAGCIGKV